jgi:hypothetical protein
MSANVLNLNSLILWPKSDFQKKKNYHQLWTRVWQKAFDSQKREKYALQAQINIGLSEIGTFLYWIIRIRYKYKGIYNKMFGVLIWYWINRIIGLSSYWIKWNVLYLVKHTNMNKTVKKKVNFINSSQNEELSPSCIALSFDGFGSISWHSIWFFRLLYSVHNFFFDFQLFLLE